VARGTHELQCRTNLTLLYDALTNYRKRNSGLWPPTLSELVPQYINDLSILSCPVSAAAGITSPAQVRRTGVKDPQTTYFYEFHLEKLEGSKTRTNRDWKLAQMRIVGSNLPMVRCFAHSPTFPNVSRVLNLAVGGHIFEGGLTWEKEFEHIASQEELSENYLMGETTARVVVVPQRQTNTPLSCLDLTSVYTRSLASALPEGLAMLDLSGVPTGLVRLNDIQFDIRGAVQFASASAPGLYPEFSAPIPIGRLCRTFHLIQSVMGTPKSGTVVANLVLETADRSRMTLPLVFGQHVGSARAQDKSVQMHPAAYEGLSGQRVTVYQARLSNPSPDKLVTAIRIEEATPEAGLLIFAISLE
jgi:hypothetical protein